MATNRAHADYGKPSELAPMVKPVSYSATLARQGVPPEILARWTAEVDAGRMTAEEVFTLLRVYLLVRDKPDGGFATCLVTMLVGDGNGE